MRAIMLGGFMSSIDYDVYYQEYEDKLVIKFTMNFFLLKKTRTITIKKQF